MWQFGLRICFSALQDLNRGRSYLANLANRSGVRVFSDIEEAVLHVIRRLTDEKYR